MTPPWREVLALIHAELGAAPPGATGEQVAALGQRLGLAIPCELQGLLLLCPAPQVGPAGILGIAPTQPFLDLETILGQQRDDGWADRGWLPIAGDGCGSYYVMVSQAFSPTGHPIYFIDERDARVDLPPTHRMGRPAFAARYALTPA